jgi:hypothetical protein
MSFSENKKIILKSCEAFLKFRIVDCGSKLNCPQDKTIKKFDFKTLFRKKSEKMEKKLHIILAISDILTTYKDIEFYT